LIELQPNAGRVAAEENEINSILEWLRAPNGQRIPRLHLTRLK
jgi:hypothetical protein